LRSGAAHRTALLVAVEHVVPQLPDGPGDGAADGGQSTALRELLARVGLLLLRCRRLGRLRLVVAHCFSKGWWWGGKKSARPRQGRAGARWW